MDITDVKRLRGAPPGVVGACSGPFGAPPVAPVAPDRCPCAVLFSTGRGVLQLAREGPTAKKKHGPEHRWGVCCRGNIADHGHYRREAITGCAPGCGRSVLRAIRCASCRAGCSRSLSLCGASQYRTRGPLHLAREGPTARFRHDGGTHWK